MKLLKIFFISILIHNTNAYDDLDLKEYEIEIIIFKYSQSSTNETFDAEFIAPADKVLKFYNPSLKINSDLYKTQYKENFFNKLLKGFKLDPKNKIHLLKKIIKAQKCQTQKNGTGNQII